MCSLFSASLGCVLKPIASKVAKTYLQTKCCNLKAAKVKSKTVTKQTAGSHLYWSHPGVLYCSGKNGPVKAEGKIKCPCQGSDTEVKIMSGFLSSLLLCSVMPWLLSWDEYRCGMNR